MRRRQAVLLAIAAPLAAFVGYEGFAVVRAQARTPEVFTRFADRPLTLEAFGERRIAMLLRVEDPGFWTHGGVDYRTPGQGRTTLTQGLVKQLYFDAFKPGFAKIEQSLIAWAVFDRAVSKREQLSMYVNHAYFGTLRGRAVHGFDDAARTWIGKPYAGLDDGEFLKLLAMPIGPNRLNPIRHPEANASRVRRIEALLAGRCRPAGLADVTYEGCDA